MLAIKGGKKRSHTKNSSPTIGGELDPVSVMELHLG